MDIRATSNPRFVQPNIDEQRINLSRVFSSLKEKQRPEQLVNGRDLVVYERFKRLAKVNASAIQETQSTLQAFHEMRQNVTQVLSLLMQLQSLATQRITHPQLSPEDARHIQEQAIEIKQQLHSLPLPHQEELKNLMRKYTPAPLGEDVDGTVALSNTHEVSLKLDSFSISSEELNSLSLEPSQVEATHSLLTDLTDRVEGALSYIQAFEGRLYSRIRLLEKQELPTARIATLRNAQETSQLLQQQIVEKAGTALLSQANVAYPEAMLLLS